jgi:polyhydroxyalkanoate synthesis regulator phasin
MTASLNSGLAGASMSPNKRYTPRATADYSKLGQNLKAQMTQSYPKAAPELSDAAAPKLDNVRGPMPPVKPNTEALHAMRGSLPPDTSSVFGNAAATVSKLRPIRDSLSLKVGKLSVGQGRALMDAGMKTAAAQAEVVRQNMDDTKKQMDNGRRRLAAMQERQREHSVRIARRLRVKFDSIPQHLRDFAARAGKELLVPAGLEERPLEKMLSGAGVVGFRGPGMAAYEDFMASQ